MALPREKLSLEEFLRLPERKPALEYVDGSVTPKVSPRGKDSRLQTRLVEMINRQCVPPRLACAFAELRTTFGGRSLVPDVAVYRWERSPRDADGAIGNDFTTPPDIVVEIVSPERSVIGLVRRCRWCVSQGVPAAVLVDPSEKGLLLFRPDQIPQVLDATGELDFDDGIPGLVLSAATLFAALRLEEP